MSSGHETLFLSPDPAHKSLTQGDYLKPETWQALNPELHIQDQEFFRNPKIFNLDSQTAGTLNQLLKHEGYFQLSTPGWDFDVRLLAQAVNRICAAELQAPFAFIYDEFWLAFCQLHQILASLLGGDYRYLPDFWVWRVDPARDDSGWSPHRDKGHKSLLPDGSPKSLTVWIPLTVASPLNSCMYLVPAHRDPTYNTEQEKEHRFALPDIRALPGQPGDAFFWNQAVLHWGSRSSRLSQEPRISMAFEFQRTDVAPFNEPLLDPLQVYSFNSRLRLIGKQVLQYQHMYALTPAQKAFAQSCLQA
ncbi:MAG: phytanoyl-CoA dioxygenase family protein [Pseudohongiellaceae bacterium]